MHVRIEMDDVTNATVNREASFLRGMLSRAVEWDIMQYNPLQKLKILKEAPKREVQISIHDIERIVKSLQHPLDAITKFAFYTGHRIESILSLKIEDTVFYELVPESMPQGHVIITVKGGERQQYPISHNAADVLTKVIGEREFDYVFVNPLTEQRYTKSILKTFRTHIRELDIRIQDGSYFRFHDLRHVFASMLLNQGVGLDDIRVFMGHRDLKTTDRYATIDKNLAGRVLNKIPEISRSKTG